jgi:hypothetical protein
MSQKSPPAYVWRIRSYPDAAFQSLWLIRRDGEAEGAILFNDVLPAVAEEIIAATNLPVEREERNLTNVRPMAPPRGGGAAAGQGDLFGAGGP